MQEQGDAQLTKRLGELLKGGDYDYTRPKVGEVREAVIVHKGDREFIVDLGVKRDGVIPSRDLDYVEDDYLDSLQPGDTIPVVVMRRGLTQNDTIQVSLNRGMQQQDWLRAQEMLETGEILEAEVVDHNRGGVLVQFGRIRGFVPNSHLGSLPSGVQRGKLQETKEELVGQILPLVVIEVNRRRRRLVLSKRAVDRRRRAGVLEELEPGQTRTGVVQNIVDFGAFVDLGGIDGLIHISELAHEHVNHPNDVLDVGDEVQVYVLNVDKERQRIGLSRKRLLPDPWEEITVNLTIGGTVRGTVTNVVDFGLFVDLGKGVEGLVHQSEVPPELAPRIVPDLSGTEVTVQILYINNEKQQLGLRLIEIHGGPETLSEEIEPEPLEEQEGEEGLEAGGDVLLY